MVVGVYSLNIQEAGESFEPTVQGPPEQHSETLSIKIIIKIVILPNLQSMGQIK